MIADRTYERYRGRLIGIGSFDATVRIWDAKSQNMKPIQVLGDAKDSVTSVVVQGHDIITGSVDGRLRCYDLRKGMLNVDLIGRRSFSYHEGFPLDRSGIQHLSSDFLFPLYSIIHHRFR